MRGPRSLLIPIVAVAMLAPVPTALADHREGPCNLHQREDESVQSHMKRIIRCAVDLWDVPGGAKKAICIADVESHLNPEAVSDNGDYLGLYQHSARYWPDRYEAWTRAEWELPKSALSGRTNAIVTVRMVHANGWGAWPDVCKDDARPRDPAPSGASRPGT